MNCCLQMNSTVYQGERRLPVSGAIAWGELKDGRNAVRRRRALKMVDRELSKGNYRTALSLVKQLNGKPGGLRGFGAAKQVIIAPSLFIEFRQRILFVQALIVELKVLKFSLHIIQEPKIIHG